MDRYDRRAFLGRMGLATLGAWMAPEVLRRHERAYAQTAATTVNPAGTTLEATFIRPPGAGYQRLIEGPGWPIVVRDDMAAPKSGREDRRRPLAAIVHLTDIHMIDAQSPARVEFLDRYSDPPGQSIPFSSAFRAQEALSPHVAESMVRRIAELAGGPVTGRVFDCAVSTGDNGDNQQYNELAWYLAVLDGAGLVTPNSGAPDRYEGVQDHHADTYDVHYWHPDGPPPGKAPDIYTDAHGFPTYIGLLAAAIAPFRATGLPMPWYSVYGNHDALLQGNSPTNAVFEAIATGPVKVVSLPAGISPADFSRGLAEGDPAVLNALLNAPARPVTADASRRIVSAQDWVAAHLDVPATPGPVGHGFTDDNRTSGKLYYTFPIAPGVVGITLDTVNRGGYSEGSIGTQQLAWLEDQLEAHADELVVLFSHHNLATITNPMPDPPGAPGSDPERVLAAGIKAVLHRHDNVVAWVNGHIHANRVFAHADPSGDGSGFWEISTAAHVDYPQQARLVELVDNRDGTLSIFTTLIEHAAPLRPPGDPRQVLHLASLSRELSANDFQVNLADALGAEKDRNVELVLKAPPVAALSDGGDGVQAGTSTGAGADAGAGAAADATRAPLPATGLELSPALAVGAAALGGAIALRERGRRLAEQDAAEQNTAQQNAAGSGES